MPEKGQPLNFSNLVGQFEISTTIGKLRLKAGDTTTLTVKIFGVGNIQDAIFSLPDISKNFKSYADEPKLVKKNKNKQLYGEKSFKFALVPLKEGNFQIPSISLSYFDPKEKSYKTTQTKSISLDILPADTNEKINLVNLHLQYNWRKK